MSFLSAISAAITPANQAVNAFQQGKQDRQKAQEAESLKMLEQLRKAQEAQEQGDVRKATLRNIDSQIKVREAPPAAATARNIDRLSPEGREAELDLATRLQGIRAQGATKYEERPEQGGVAIYEDGRFKSWKVRPESETRGSQEITRQIGRETSLAQRYEQTPPVKEAFGIANAASGIHAAAKGNSPQDDVSLLYQVVKLLDPDSAVREGEINLQRAARSIGTQLEGAWLKAKSGKLLTTQERANILALVDRKVNASKAQVAPVQRDFGRLSKRAGADSALVARDPYEGVGKFGGVELLPPPKKKSP